MNIPKVLLWLFGAVLLVLSCTNDNDDNVTTNENTLTTAGTWRVTYFWDKDKDETSDFAGYTFVFESGGVFKATKTGVTTTGSWQLNASGSKLIINTGSAAKPLEELNDDWLLLEKADKRIHLKDDSDDADGEELLTLEVL